MIPSLTLNTGASMPALGLGLFKITDQAAMDRTISDALSIGYRLFDTASVYKNEAELGNALMRCHVPREELFITTKVWNTAQRIGNIEDALELFFAVVGPVGGERFVCQDADAEHQVFLGVEYVL